VERPRSAAAVESGFVAAAAGTEVALPAGAATFGAGYSLEQLAYLAQAAEDYSIQQHDVVLAVRAHRGPSAVLEAALLGQYALTGVSDLRGMQAAAGARLSAAYAWGDRQVTRALLGATAKDGRGAEFAPLDCTAADVERLSYQGHTGWLGIRHEPRPWLRLDVTGGVEGRWELDELHTVLTASDGGEVVVGRRRRSDVRGFGSEALALRLAPGLFFTLRHEWLVNRTRVEAISYVPPRALGTSGWDKHVLAAGLTLDW
jgi:hypothetical protein